MPESYANRSLGSTLQIRNVNTINYSADQGWYILSTARQFLVGERGWESRSFSGSTFPQWKTFRKTNGYLPVLAATDHIQRHRYTFRTVHRTDPTSGLVTVSGFNSVNTDKPNTYSGSKNGEVEDIAWAKLRARVLDADLNALVFMGELNKTLDMIYDKVKILATLYRSFRKMDFRSIERTLFKIGVPVRPKRPLQWSKYPKTKRFKKRFYDNPTEYGDLWLEYKYGWSPLVNDIYGAAKHLAELPYRRDLRIISANYTQEFVIPTPELGARRCSNNVKVSCRAGVVVKLFDKSLLNSNRLGLLNPALLAWELIPFSFVVDWFVNVGQCIEQANAFAGHDVLSSYTSTVSVQSASTYGWPDEYEDNPPNHYWSRRLHRRPDFRDVPALRINLNPLDFSKLVTSAALLRQTFRSSKGKGF